MTQIVAKYKLGQTISDVFFDEIYDSGDYFYTMQKIYKIIEVIYSDDGKIRYTLEQEKGGDKHVREEKNIVLGKRFSKKLQKEIYKIDTKFNLELSKIWDELIDKKSKIEDLHKEEIFKLLQKYNKKRTE